MFATAYVKQLKRIVIVILVPYYCRRRHIISKAVGGKGSKKDKFKMIAYGDAPGLLFGWTPYFATISSSGVEVIQLLVWPVVLQKISWEKPSFIAILVGLGNIEMALS